MKIKGKLISDEFGNVEFNALHGDTVTIELPRGMRVIGKCGTCNQMLPESNLAGTVHLSYCAKREMIVGNNFGCIDWKERKE